MPLSFFAVAAEVLGDGAADGEPDGVGELTELEGLAELVEVVELPQATREQHIAIARATAITFFQFDIFILLT